jgi:predicted RNase H-like HicB family nuclease
MNYPIVIHKDKKSDYGVTVPDLPGCFSAGATVDESLAMAKEAIELHLEGLIDGGQTVPQPSTIDQHLADTDYAGGTWAVVSIDPEALRVNAKRLSITMPQRILDAADRFARARGYTRSGLLVQAVTAFIGRDMGKAPNVRRGKRKRRPTNRPIQPKGR